MSKKITKAQKKAFLKESLRTNLKWAQRGLLIIYSFQTEEEQVSEDTRFYNTIGFTGADAPLLSSFAKQLIRGRQLSGKQVYLLHKKMPKYWRQLMEVSIPEKLEEGTRKWLDSRLFS